VRRRDYSDYRGKPVTTFPLKRYLASPAGMTYCTHFSVWRGQGFGEGDTAMLS
jgi:hypothetical protein